MRKHLDPRGAVATRPLGVPGIDALLAERTEYRLPHPAVRAD